VNEFANLTPPPTWHPPWFNYCLDLLFFILVYPIGYSLTLGSFFSMSFYEYILYVPDFISMVEHYNCIGYVISLDRYNLFLLVLAYMSLTELLYGLLAMHLFACCISQCALDAIKNFAYRSQGSHPLRQLRNCSIQEVVILLAHP
jgi:hypothetical protein